MRQALIILFFAPLLSFGQFTITNTEVGVSFYSFQGTPNSSPPQLYTDQFINGAFARINRGQHTWRINFDKISYDEAYTLSKEMLIYDYDHTVNANHQKISLTFGKEKRFLRSSFHPILFVDLGIYRSHYEGEKWSYAWGGLSGYEHFKLTGYGTTLSFGSGFYWEFVRNVSLRVETTVRIDKSFQSVSSKLVSLETGRLTFNPIQRLGISYFFND